MNTNPHRLKCPGWPADWINTWLAAIGTTVLVPDLQVSWTKDAHPVAVLEHSSKDPTLMLTESWPNKERIISMPLASSDLYRRTTKDGGEKPKRKVLVESFTRALKDAHGHIDAWTLTSTMTDLSVQENGEVGNGPFDPSGPGTIKWLHYRLLKAHSHIQDPATQIQASLKGIPNLVNDNGLGFDIARLNEGEQYTDPVVETLAFFGLTLFPVRGDGVNQKIPRPRQRGWQIANNRDFMWPAWTQPLDKYGIDALLDAWHHSWRNYKRGQTNVWKRLGVHAAWQTVRYQATASADPTRGYGSQRLSPK